MPQLLVFAKAPELGKAKTRLISSLGEAGAQQVARSLLEQTLDNIAGWPGGLTFCITPIDWPHWQSLLPARAKRVDQGLGDLGARLTRCVATAFADDDGPVIVMGTDCPELTEERLVELVQVLETHDAAIIPAWDGGYVALAMRKFSAQVFADITWSTDKVAQQTITQFERLDWVWRVLPALRDIDELDDLHVWQTARKGEGL
jgi:rSAM/selenodomain-associated transferase 1